MRKSYFSPDNREKKPFPLGLVLALVINTAVLFGIYCYFVMRENVNWLFWVYYGLLAASACFYVFYNRGFSREKYTMDTLPPDWTYERKKEFLDSRDRRKKQSKWLLTVIFPLCITVLFDMIGLYFGPQLAKLWSDVVTFFTP